MSQPTHRFVNPGRLFATVLTVLACGANGVQAQGPQIGDVQTLAVMTVFLQVGSTGKDTRLASYTPPPGWEIRRHLVICYQKYGNASYALSIVPSDWSWSFESQSSQSQQRLMEAAAHPYQLPLQARLRERSNEAQHEQRSFHSSHHALILDASVTGEGLLRNGSGLHLSIIAELVYVGPAARARVTLSERPSGSR